MTYKFNHQNTIYKKRSPNESKININNNQNNIEGKNINIQKINIIQNNSINNIYDFDNPHQNCSKTFLGINNKNNITNSNDINNVNYFYNGNNSNYNVSTPLSGNKILSQRYLIQKENNNGNNKEHMNNFKNYKIRTDINNNKLLNKSNDISEIRNNQMRSPRIYQKKFDHKNRPFILQKENNNKPNIISNNSYNTKNKIYINEVDYHQDLDNISTKQNEFKKEIREIYNQQKKQKNIIECRRVNNFELSGIKKNNLIKPPIIIDENKNENIIGYDNSSISNIDKKKIKLNKEKSNYTFNENIVIKKYTNNLLIKPKNKYMFKAKYYCYHIKIYKNDICYFGREIVTKKPITKRINKISNNL